MCNFDFFLMKNYQTQNKPFFKKKKKIKHHMLMSQNGNDTNT